MTVTIAPPTRKKTAPRPPKSAPAPASPATGAASTTAPRASAAKGAAAERSARPTASGRLRGPTTPTPLAGPTGPAGPTALTGPTGLAPVTRPAALQPPAPMLPAPLLPPLPPGAQRGSRRKGIAFEKSKCGSCIALCCRYFALEVDRPTVPKDFENLRWYLLHARVNVFVEGRRWFVQIFNTCQALGPDNRCTIYDTRPGICREYDNDVCDKDEALGDSTSDQLFRTVGELEAYRDTWVARYQARKRRERKATAAKLARKRRRAASARKTARRAPAAR